MSLETALGRLGTLYFQGKPHDEIDPLTNAAPGGSDADT